MEEEVLTAIETMTSDRVVLGMDIALDHHLLVEVMVEEVLIATMHDDGVDPDLHSGKEDDTRVWIRDLLLTMIVLCRDGDLNRYLTFRSLRSSHQKGMRLSRFF